MSVLSSVSRETAALLARFERMVAAEAASQNLVSAKTLDDLASRHIEDSLQLQAYVRGGSIVDIGSGAGFPGVVLAICQPRPVTLIEPRRLRARFLQAVIDDLSLSATTSLIRRRVEVVRAPPAGTITARAVAPLDRLFGMAAHLADAETVWVLPKGRRARDEVETASRTWHGDFHLAPSATDPEAAIVIVRNLRRRCE